MENVLPDVLPDILFGLTVVAAAVWIGLLLFWGQFWRADQRLDAPGNCSLENWPSVAVVIPARNEAELIESGGAIASHPVLSRPSLILFW